MSEETTHSASPSAGPTVMLASDGPTPAMRLAGPREPPRTQARLRFFKNQKITAEVFGPNAPALIAGSSGS